MKRHRNESLNPRYQKEHFESQQAILASLTTLTVFLNSPYLVPSAVDWAVAPFTHKRAPAMANNVNIPKFLHIF